jgi:hypothetical protein
LDRFWNIHYFHNVVATERRRYGRPEAFLDPEVRQAQSAWDFWDRKLGHRRTQTTFTGALRLIVASL